MRGRLSTLGKVPILIVGGGLGGFTAALSLHRAGIRNNIVIRQDKFTQHARSGVFLGSSAVRILDRLGLGPQFRTLGTPTHRVEIEDIKGRKVLSIHLEKIGTEVWTVPRADLQQAFYESIPAESVHFDTRFRDFNVGENSVEVKLQRTSDRSHLGLRPSTFSCSTKFVIGADGLNSPVRMAMSRPTMTVSSGTFVWKAVVQNQDIKKYPFHIGKEVWDFNRRFGFVRMNPEEVVWWAVISKFDQVLLRPFTPHLLRLFDNFPKDVLDLISSVSSDRSVFRAEMKRVWPEQLSWVDPNSSRIALVGDAGRPGNIENVHTSATFAVEDSYLLAHHIAGQRGKGNASMHLALQAYEESRKDQVDTIRKYWNRFDMLSVPQSRIRRYFVQKFVKSSIESLAISGSSSTMPATMSEQLRI